MEIFVVGDWFMMFAEVEKKIHQYEKEKFVQFYKRDSRSVTYYDVIYYYIAIYVMHIL